LAAIDLSRSGKSRQLIQQRLDRRSLNFPGLQWSKSKTIATLGFCPLAVSSQRRSTRGWAASVGAFSA
jgi:hypothetical protein